jgi:hypothetical protein
MAKILRSLNFKRKPNCFTEGNPERTWPHVLNTVGINTSNPVNLDFSLTPQLDSRITFTRSTVATVTDFEGLIKSTRINEIRFTGARRVGNGVNTSSEDLTVAAWAKTNSTTPSANTIMETAATGAHIVLNNKDYTAIGIVVVLSCEIKSGLGRDWVLLYLNGAGGAYFNVTTGAIGNLVSTGINAAISPTPNPDGYYTCTVQVTTTAASGNNPGLYVASANGTISYAGDITKGLYARKFQAEEVTGQANKNPSEYVSIGVLSAPYKGAGVDGVQYFPYQNGNTITGGVFTPGYGAAISNITMLLEEARTNVLLNSAVPVTQSTSTSAQVYAISMWGTGTCTLTGSATGLLTGTGVSNRVSLTVTATAGTLTLTFAGSNTNGQVEAGNMMTSYIPTTASAVTRTVDSASFVGANTSWFNPNQGTFVITASGRYSSSPGNVGVWNPLLTNSGTYAFRYNRAVDNSAYLYTPNGAANPVEYQSIPVPTTILLAEQGVMNLSKFVYYSVDLGVSSTAALVNGTLTTSFDTSYTATTDFTSAFRYFPFGAPVKYFPKINTSNGTIFLNAWRDTTNMAQVAQVDTAKSTTMSSSFSTSGIPSIPIFNTGLVTNFSYMFSNSTIITTLPLLNTISGTDFTGFCINCSSLTTVPSGLFNNAKSILYSTAFNNCSLTQASVDNILVSINQSRINTPSLINGTLNIVGGTNATPSATGLAAKTALTTAGWTVTNN